VASEADFVPDQRLHPLSWLFVLLASIKQFIVPIIAVVVFGARDDGSAWGALFVFPLLIAAVWRQYLFRYGFGPRGLVIRDGLFFRNIRQIEYERIENIDTERGVLHRLMNVAEVRLESSTGGKAEALIRVLGMDAVQELRERIFGRAHAGATHVQPAVPPREEILLRLPPAELVRYGFVDNRGMLIVAAVFGFISQSGAIDRGAGKLIQERFFAEAFGAGGLSLAAVALGVFITIVLFVRLLSLLWALVALHDFTLSRHGTDLRIRYGLLTRVALTLRLSRIQAVHQSESVLHRFFGRVSLAVDLAGDGGQRVDENGSPQTRMRWLAPICTPRRAVELARSALPMLTEDTQPEWQTLATGAKMRLFRKIMLVTTLILATPAIYWLQYQAPLLWLVLVPLAWLHATQYVRHARWALTREALLFRRGWLTRRLSIVPRSRVQVAHLVMSPFDRRTDMATLMVDTAGASALSGIVRIPYLPHTAATTLAAQLHSSARELPVQGNASAVEQGPRHRTEPILGRSR
jgi:putative membrane protein